MIAATCRNLNTNSRRLTQSPFRSTGSASTKCQITRRQPSSVCLRRSYHSYDHPSPVEPFSPTERIILAAAYAHVPEHGFSQESLALGARDAGYLDISTNLLPNGIFSLVQWHMVSQRESLAGRARDLFSGEERMGVGRKVEVLVWERLMGNEAVIGRWQEVRLHHKRRQAVRGKKLIETWPQALAIMAQPSYVPESLKELAKLSDEIWFLVGDTAVDSSWYTKRASLSTIYASTELFMTTDRSEGFAETRKFLRRRLKEVQEVGGTFRSLGQWVGFTASAGLNVLRSKGMPI